MKAPRVQAAVKAAAGGRAVKLDAGDNDDKNYDDVASGGTTSIILLAREARPVRLPCPNPAPMPAPWASRCATERVFGTQLATVFSE